MDTCHDLVAKMEETGDIPDFERTVFSPGLKRLLHSFDDDFYGGRDPKAPDVSLFNLLYQAEKKHGLTSWRTEYPELLDHFETVAKVGHIPLYLSRKSVGMM